VRRSAPAPRLLAPTLAALALFAWAAPAQAQSPWWQLLTGSRPTYLQPAPDQSEEQEVSTAKVVLGEFGEGVAVPIEVGGEAVGCLGSGEVLSRSAAEICEEETGFGATETPEALAALLEGLYGSEVELSGPEGEGEAPAWLGEGDFTLTTPGRWVSKPLGFGPPLSIVFEENTYALGSASSQVTSEDSGRLVITATNLGDAPLDATETPLQITESLPAGVQAYDVEAYAGGAPSGVSSAGPVDCELPSTAELHCSFESSLPSYEAIEVEVLVALKDSAEDGEAAEVTLSGGRGPAGQAAPGAEAAQPISVSSEPVRFGIERFSAQAEEEGGAPTTQAGVHPFQLTQTFQWNSGRVIPGEGRPRGFVEQPALPRNTALTFPVGLVGSATAVPPCPLADFLTLNVPAELVNPCPPASVVGVASVTINELGALGFQRLAVPIFALPPERGEPARFGFMPFGVPVIIGTSLDPSDEYRVTGEVRNASQAAQVLSATLTLWGVPGDPRHDSSRGWGCTLYTHTLPCEATTNREQTPFLRMPVSCASPLGYRGLAEPWNAPPGSGVRPRFEAPALRGCSRVPFDPAISNALTSKLASGPSGLDLRIDMPDKGLENPKEGAISEAQFKRAEIVFPEGVTVNPSIAEGLAVCSEAAYEAERYDSRPGEGCPQASKIGSVQISTPLLAEQATGAVYQATPYENKTESLIGLYLIARIPARGVLVKQPIEVRPDPVTGQLVSIAENVPQLPFSSFEFHFREGGRSPLITPPGCGTFNTVARFVPWSAADPDNPDPSEVVERQATFTIERGVDGGACPQGPAPFHPGFEAGTLNNQAGAYSPFLMHLTRGDGEQDMGKFSFTLPPGVLGRLAGIPYCPEAGIARAQGRQGPHGGQEEIDDPSCPAASRIGTTLGGAGVGNQLTYVKGSLYLAGPWHGDPLSVVAITPAVAGPFDAGTVVVREALRLNPITARAEVDGAASDPIPHILKGIPLSLRDLRVYADRPDFTLNATSCEPFKAESTIWGDGTALEPLSPSPAELSSRYQAAGCASLGFKPKLNLRLKGGTRRGAFPALRAAYVPRKHNQANLSRLTLTFPNSAFIEQGHFRTICTRVQFAAGPGFGANCPKGSVYGDVKVWTPLLDEPLQGPVYLRSSNHNLPDAVLALHGLVDIEVAVRIDSVHGRLRATVSGAPDAPVSRAIVNMQGGQKGLFVNSTNLCLAKHRARVNAKGQNGKRLVLKPLVRAVSCKKAHRKRHRGHRRRGGRR
jgi:hypothetical protein